jgi:hypothetical protein
VSDFIDPRDARDLFPGKPAYRTILRWIKTGVRDPRGRVRRLEHRRLGRKLFTTRRWIADFISGTPKRAGGR